ncbi:MAG TPA: hypothetical protein ENK80_01065 [Rhodobacterales bacterium]|nr:hypothetical protein [Rhodobacterales bacterium]
MPDGPTLVEETTPDQSAAEQTPVETLPAQAPRETTTEIVTEAEQPSDAPTASIRPRARPTPPPLRTAQPPAETPAPATASADAIDSAVESAVDSALADVLGAQTAPAPSGPPLTRGEKDGLRVAVQRCWNVGSLSTDALGTTVVVLVKMARNGRPEGVELVSSSNQSSTATSRAYEAARRAVIRCGASGYPLPSDKYDQWREIEMTFDPSNMRVR